MRSLWRHDGIAGVLIATGALLLVEHRVVADVYEAEDIVVERPDDSPIRSERRFHSPGTLALEELYDLNSQITCQILCLLRVAVLPVYERGQSTDCLVGKLLVGVG